MGIIIDSKLSWDTQITAISKEVNRILLTLRFIRHCKIETLRTRLVQALIVPHFDYCNTVYVDANITLKARLQRLSNASLRYILDTKLRY